uniref:Uncharacterized protein n=1 Tax=Timema genevievae TaxID=629358 RepID=A0A7R9K437_TIMGE|nr:unnamed protein product [Timema genevievae]
MEWASFAYKTGPLHCGLGGGHVLRNVDSLGGGSLQRHVRDFSLPMTCVFVIAGGGHVLRNVDSLGGGSLLRHARGGLDSLSGVTFGGVKRFDSLRVSAYNAGRAKLFKHACITGCIGVRGVALYMKPWQALSVL